MKVAFVNTAIAPGLIQSIENEIRNVTSDNVEFVSYSDLSILTETRKNGYVTAKATARLMNMFLKAIDEDSDVILVTCTSVGDIVDLIQDLSKYIRIPILRIDEEMCIEALKLARRIGIIGTVSTSLISTKKLLYRLAEEKGINLQIVDVLIDGVDGVPQDVIRELIMQHAKSIVEDVDVIILAQGSMAFCEDFINKKLNKKVISSPKYAAIYIGNYLSEKGLL